MNNLKNKIRVGIDSEDLEIILPDVKASSLEEEWKKYDEREDYFPYWLSAWNASFALYSFFKSQSIKLTGPLLEVGCGNGTWAQLMPEYQSSCFYTDLVYDAVLQTRHVCNGKARCAAMDLRADCFSISFGTLIATELAYEDHLVDAWVRLVQSKLAVGGKAYFCETVKAGREGNEERVRSQWTGSLKVFQHLFSRDGVKLSAKIFVLEKR